MEVLLLGTGGPRGWPEPGCTCASCSTAARTGAARAAARALVDGVLLLDAGTPDAPTPTGHRVRALTQGAGVAWEVVAPDGARLLWAPGADDVEVDGPPYDLVLMGLPPAGGPPLVAALRRDGAVTATTQVRAIGHDHDRERADVLQHLLPAWGVLDTRDGEVLQTGTRAVPVAAGRTLVLGGVRSGKSALAEQLAAGHPHVTYVATGGTRDGDAEWQQRVEAHRARRPASWRTVETTDLTTCLREAEGALLVDCLGTWLTALLDQHGVWDGGSLAPVEAAVDELLAAWRAARVPLVAVSNEVGSGVVPATPSGRLFRDLLGRLNARVAAESESVLLTVAGVPVPLRTPTP